MNEYGRGGKVIDGLGEYKLRYQAGMASKIDDILFDHVQEDIFWHICDKLWHDIQATIGPILYQIEDCVKKEVIKR